MGLVKIKESALDKQNAKNRTVKSLISREKLDAYNKRFDHSDEFLSGSLLTLASMISSPRENMFLQQLPQCNMMLDPEVPDVYTGYERAIGAYTMAKYTSDRQWQVIHKITRYKNHPELFYYLIVMDQNGTFDIIKRTFGEQLTESYGYMNNNALIDSKQPDGMIFPGETLYKCSAFDDAMNYRYGKNANVVFLGCTQVTEDAIWMNEEFAKKLQYPMIHTINLTLNINEILLNLYGHDTVYKTFPDILEDTRLKVLCAKRRISNKSIIYNLKDTNLRNIHFHEDDAYYVDGKVVGIDVFCNRNPEDIAKNPVNAQLLYYYNEQQEFYQDVRKKLHKIISKNPGRVSDELLHVYHRAEDLTSGKTVVNGTSKFENISVIFTVLSVHHAKTGYKITGRFGEKGVIGLISPQEDMPLSEYGVYTDMVLSPQGVFGRLNTGQWSETNLTFLSDNIVRELRTNNIPYVLGIPIIFAYLHEVNPKQAQDTSQFYASCDEAYKEAFYTDMITNGIKIHQPPFWDNCRFDELRRLYAKYPYRRYRFTYKGQPIIRRLTMGRKYIMLLKQTPESKYSVRSLGMQSALGHPSKSIKFKKYGLPNSDTPIRLGEMECINLLMMNDPDSIAIFLSAYANSQKNREALVAQTIQAENPFIINFHPVETLSINRKMLNAFFKVGGVGLID
jgi:hypothetical protein